MLVALTRERGQNEELRDWVGGRAEVVEIPLTTTAFRDAGEVEAEIRASRDVGAFRTLVATSARVERYLPLAARALGPDPVVASVGPATTRVLERAGLRVTHESLGGALDLIASVNEGPVLILAATGGREELTAALRSRGVACAVVECYATRGVALGEAERAALGRADVVFIGAPSAWRVAREAVRSDAWVLVPGATTLAAVRAGHERCVVGWGPAFAGAWERITAAPED